MLSRMIRRGRAPKQRDRRPQPSLSLECLEGREVPAIVYGLSSANTLVRFDSATPTAVTAVAITGLQTGAEHVIGVDFRPRTGQLYAVTVPTGSAANATVRTYTINAQTGVA